MPRSRLFSAFASRNYRLYFGGQAVSLVGTWMTQTASLWLVYHLSSSPFNLGLVGFASQFPIFLLAPFAGVMVDRVNRHRLLILTQICSMLQSFSLAAFALTGTIGVPHLVVLSLFQGVISAFDLPVRQAMVVEFVENREHLGNAIALNSSLFNLARLVGPAIGGFVIAAFGGGEFGVGMCYLIDGASYLSVLVALLMMQMSQRPRSAAKKHPWHDLREGFSYALGFAPIRALIILVAAISAIGFSYTVLTPVFARDVFRGDAQTLGWLMSSSGVGAVLAALYLGNRPSVRGLGNVITRGGMLLGVAIMGFSMSRWLPVSMLCLLMAGMGGVLLMASANTLIQSMVDDDKRGRVMSLFTTAFTSTAPLGNLLAGAVAGKIGSGITLTVSGMICICIVMIFHRALPKLREAAHPVLAKLDATTLDPVIYPVTGESGEATKT
ncbi:MAG TPA: MFS transporter [Verrucomicrobiaceae bacterium]|jgi:MFS family permease